MSNSKTILFFTVALLLISPVTTSTKSGREAPVMTAMEGAQWPAHMPWSGLSLSGDRLDRTLAPRSGVPIEWGRS